MAAPLFGPPSPKKALSLRTLYVQSKQIFGETRSTTTSECTTYWEHFQCWSACTRALPVLIRKTQWEWFPIRLEKLGEKFSQPNSTLQPPHFKELMALLIKRSWHPMASFPGHSYHQFFIAGNMKNLVTSMCIIWTEGRRGLTPKVHLDYAWCAEQQNSRMLRSDWMHFMVLNRIVCCIGSAFCLTGMGVAGCAGL